MIVLKKMFVLSYAALLGSSLYAVRLECDVTFKGGGLCSLAVGTTLGEFGVDDWHRYAWEFSDLTDSGCRPALGAENLAEWSCDGPKGDVFLLSGPAAFIPANTRFQVELEVAPDVKSPLILYFQLVDRDTRELVYSRHQMLLPLENNDGQFHRIVLPEASSKEAIEGLDLIAWVKHLQNPPNLSGALKFRRALLRLN